MPTSYDPSDGDYIDADYTKLLNDIQTAADFEIGEFLEICVSITNDDEIFVQGTNDGTGWIWDRTFPIPDGWQIETIREMFPGYVYLEPVEKSEKPESIEDDCKHEFDRDEVGLFCIRCGAPG